MTASVESARKGISRKKESLLACRRARKIEGESMYTGVDLILQKFGIVRAAYHGGDLNGGGIKIFMGSAHEIMKEVKEYLLKTKSRSCEKSDEDIAHLCDEVTTLLTLWDGALSCLHQEDPEEKHCLKAQRFIDQVLSKMRELEFSVTVKGHGSESHIVDQMRATAKYGGLCDFDESWGEQYHQVGYRFDMRLRNRGSEVRKAHTRAKRERTEGLPETQVALERKDAKFPVKKRAKTIIKEKDVARVKKERRDNALK